MKLKIWVGVMLLLSTLGTVHAAQEAPVQAVASAAGGIAMAAALSMGLAALGAGYAIAHSGAAAIGAIAERPEVSTWGLIIVALAEGIALYGLVIAFMLLGKL